MLPQRCVTGNVVPIFAQDCSPAQSGRYAVPFWILPLARLPKVRLVLHTISWCYLTNTIAEA